MGEAATPTNGKPTFCEADTETKLRTRPGVDPAKDPGPQGGFRAPGSGLTRCTALIYAKDI